MAAASTTDRDMMYIQIMVARVLMGILTGISTSPAAVYGAEVAHKDLRGRLIVITTLFTAFGMLLTYFLGYLWPVSNFISFLNLNINNNLKITQNLKSTIDI